MSGFCVAVAGCPYYFTTQGVSAVTFPAGETQTGSVIAQGFLETPRVSWSERVSPVDGTLDVSGFSIVLHDAVISTGPAAGFNLVSYLGTRLESDIVSTTLASSITAAATSFTVVDGPALDSFPRTVWIEREAIRCASRASNVVTVDTGGRGYHGSTAAAHTVDSTYSVYPEVWGSFPWFRGRKIVLYYVTDSGVASYLWRGYCQKVPRLTAEGGAMELQLESSWSRHRDLRLGVPDSMTRVRGFSQEAMNLLIAVNGGFAFGSRGYGQRTTHTETQDTLAEALTVAEQLLRGAVSTLSVDVYFHAAIEGNGVRMTATSATASTIACGISLGSRGDYVRDSETGTPRYTTAFVEYLPSALLKTNRGVALEYPIDNVDSLPASFAPLDYAEGSTHHTYIDPILRGEYSDDEWFDLWAGDSTPVTSYNSSLGSPSFLGFGGFTARKHGVEDRGYISVLDRTLPLKLVTRVDATHFVYGLRRIVEDTTYVRSGAESSDFSWSLANRIVGQAGASWSGRVWHLDGSQRLGDFCETQLAIHGCAMGMRDSKIAPIMLTPPGPLTTVAATITPTDLLAGTSFHFEFLDDGIRNSAHVRSGAVDLIVNEARSIGRYGQQGTISLSLDGIDFDRSLADSPAFLASNVLSKVLNLLNKPARVVKFSVPYSAFRSVFLGDYVLISSAATVPDGTGLRGAADKYGLVIGRSVSLRNNTAEFECLLYDAAVGYGPCVKVESITTDTLTIATAYVNAASDYAGSDESDYTGTGNDGGVTRFVAGMKCELVRFGNTTALREDCEVLSVDDSTPSITLNGAPTGVWATAIAAGEIVHLRLRSYTDTAAAYRTYAFVGSDTAGVIDGTADKNQEWAP